MLSFQPYVCDIQHNLMSEIMLVIHIPLLDIGCRLSWKRNVNGLSKDCCLLVVGGPAHGLLDTIWVGIMKCVDRLARGLDEGRRGIDRLVIRGRILLEDSAWGEDD